MITITILRELEDIHVTARLYPADKRSPFYGSTVAECVLSRADRTSSRLALRQALSALLAELDS